MKRVFLIISVLLVLASCNARSGNPPSKGSSISGGATVIQMTDATFKKLVFNYDENKEWKYEGTMPAIIDFYATWCGPCRQLSPVVEEIAKEYSGKIVVYKVDTDQENVLARKLGISGLPTLFFIPVKGQPGMTMGVLPKESIVKAINDVLLIKK